MVSVAAGAFFSPRLLAPLSFHAMMGGAILATAFVFAATFPMTTPNPSVGNNLRRLRTERDLSLAGVAGQAGISVATLSRVETNKQSLEVGLLLRLAGILGASASEILSGEPEDTGSLSRRVAALPAAERAQVLLDSAGPRRVRELGSTLDGLVSTVEILRDELLSVQRALGRRSRKS